MGKHIHKLVITTSVLITVIIAIALLLPYDASVNAQGIILTNNSGSENAVWFVSGESSIVINGFDLSGQGVELPAIISSVTIAVERAAPGAAVDVLVYQDANGGSPSDASLAGSFQTTIETTGTVRIELPTPIVVTEPVIWVGFRLPVDFRFYADTQGSSVLTYWAWTSGSVIDINNLGNATVLGPADGTDPVNIDMGGVARITAEVRQPSASEAIDSAPVGVQLVADGEADLSVMEPYEYCSTLLYDTEDVNVTGRGLFSLECRADTPTDTVSEIRPGTNYSRAGVVYEISAYGEWEDRNAGEDDIQRFRNPITHCIRPSSEHIEQAVMGVSTGVPRVWHILPTVRYGDLICAEIEHLGAISYFLPLPESTATTNLAFGRIIISPHPLECAIEPTWDVSVVNNGYDWPVSDGNQPAGKVVVENIHVRTGIVTNYREYHIDPEKIGPGMTWRFVSEGFPVDVYIGEEHILRFTINYDQQVQEVNMEDNIFETHYVLQNSDECRPCSYYDDEDDDSEIPDRCRDCDSWGQCVLEAPVRCWQDWVDDDICPEKGLDQKLEAGED